MEGGPAHPPPGRARGSPGSLRRPRARLREDQRLNAPQALIDAIAAAIGGPFRPTSVAAVGGGCIHTALSIEGEVSGGERPRFFAKVNEASHAPMFAAEAEGLEAIRATATVDVPRVIAKGAGEDEAWLVLEWIDLEALDAARGSRLGEALAAQHRQRQPKFGWARDNYIGTSPQINGWSEDWADFWRHRRLHAQLRLAVHNRLPSRMIDRGERLATDCDAFFATYRPVPSLLHGDLWSGNAGARAHAGPVVFDPAVYVGDREADIAMTELFGGFPKDFQSAYRNAWPLDAGYPVRRDFYNAYHLLNHSNLFAGDYVRQAERSIERLLAEIR